MYTPQEIKVWLLKGHPCNHTNYSAADKRCLDCGKVERDFVNSSQPVPFDSNTITFTTEKDENKDIWLTKRLYSFDGQWLIVRDKTYWTLIQDNFAGDCQSLREAMQMASRSTGETIHWYTSEIMLQGSGWSIAREKFDWKCYGRAGYCHRTTKTLAEAKKYCTGY